jgi:AcrR family transcriptional regulator
MRKRIVLKARKEPRQARSRQMREDILTASIRVLRREGPLRFTTLRVAEAAGISVGSLYQYFPNKQALVFAIHSRTVELAWIEVQRILDHGQWSARQKIQRITELFFLSESAEVAEMGAALQDAEIFFRNQPEHRAINEQVFLRFTRFIREALPPGAAPSRVEFSAQMLITVLESVGRAVAGLGISKPEVHRWALACAEMVADYLCLP